MKEYELVREIQNLCRNNQMRDVFISEVETDNPENYVRDFLKDSAACLTDCDGLTQKFIFTPI